MPPKQYSDEVTNAIKILCEVMVHCEVTKVNNKDLFPRLGVSRSNKVNGKVNALIGPCGYVYKSGRVSRLDDADQDAPDPSGQGSPVKNGPGTPDRAVDGNDGLDDAAAPASTGPTKKAPRARARAPRTPKKAGAAKPAAGSAEPSVPVPAPAPASAGAGDSSPKKRKLDEDEDTVHEDEA